MSLSWVPRISIKKVIPATPTITANSYVTGDRLGSIMTLTDVVRNDLNIGAGTCRLESIHIIDKAAQSPVIDIWFFNALPTIASADRTAFDLTDANALLSIGAVSIGASWSNSTSNGVNIGNGNLGKIMQISTGTNIYAVAIMRSSATFASTTDVTFQFGFEVD